MFRTGFEQAHDVPELAEAERLERVVVGVKMTRVFVGLAQGQAVAEAVRLARQAHVTLALPTRMTGS